jgi:hypothetical protein
MARSREMNPHAATDAGWTVTMHRAPACRADVAVEIESINTPAFQGDVVLDNLGNVGHGTSSWSRLKRYHPNARPWRASFAASDVFCPIIFPDKGAPQTDLSHGSVANCGILFLLVG